MNDLMLPITAWATLANGALFLLLTIKTIGLRRGLKVPFGDGGQKPLERAIRGHGNAAEQMPIALLVLGMAEISGAPIWALASMALVFTLGRISHAAYFLVSAVHWRARFFGMLLTLIAQVGLLFLLLFALLT